MLDATEQLWVSGWTGGVGWIAVEELYSWVGVPAES